MRRLLSLLLLVFVPALPATPATRLESPDRKLAVEFSLTDAGSPVYVILRDGSLVLRESRLGLLRDDADFTRALQLLSASPVERVHDRYELLTAKRRVNTYGANRQAFYLQTAAGRPMDIIFQVSNDGVAFRDWWQKPADDHPDIPTGFHSETYNQVGVHLGGSRQRTPITGHPEPGEGSSRIYAGVHHAGFFTAFRMTNRKLHWQRSEETSFCGRGALTTQVRAIGQPTSARQKENRPGGFPPGRRHFL